MDWPQIWDGPAAAHVHGITPLRCVETANDGANQTDLTPAAAANGGPITGLLERRRQGAAHDRRRRFDTLASPASP